MIPNQDANYQIKGSTVVIDLSNTMLSSNVPYTRFSFNVMLSNDPMIGLCCF